MTMKFEKATRESVFARMRAVNPSNFDRLMSRIDSSDGGACWPISGQSSGGYGRIKINGKSERAHRVMFFLFRPGPAPMVVRHVCNNPKCINPAHLRAGDQKLNALDRKLSGREGNHKGLANGRHRLTDDAVRAIRTSKESGVVLGEKYGVSRTVISCVRLMKSWKHVV